MPQPLPTLVRTGPDCLSSDRAASVSQPRQWHHVLQGLLTAVCAFGLAIAAAAAQAQTWPERPVRVIVPYGSGTPPDYLVRLVTARLSQSTGQPFTVDNRPGANSIIGMQTAAHASADGYTLVYAGLGALSINPGLFSALPYDPERDFDPVTMAFSTALYVIVGGQSPYRSLPEILAAARTGRTLNYGSLGLGSEAHLAMEDLRQRANIAMTHVPFKGGDFIPALIRGDIDLMFLGIGSISGQVSQGQLRALATGSPRRSQAFPDIPTVAETAGLEDYSAGAWAAFLVPAHTPAPLTARINAQFNATLALPDLKADLARIDFVSIGGAPELVTRTLREDRARYAKLLQLTGTKLD